jgi:hypothetical protein
VADVNVVKAASVYQVNVPVAQVPVKVVLVPPHIEGVFKPVGALGIGVTVTEVLTEGLLQFVFVELTQDA